MGADSFQFLSIIMSLSVTLQGLLPSDISSFASSGQEYFRITMIELLVLFYLPFLECVLWWLVALVRGAGEVQVDLESLPAQIQKDHK